jgi:hypothetical protein
MVEAPWRPPVPMFLRYDGTGETDRINAGVMIEILVFGRQECLP